MDTNDLGDVMSGHDPCIPLATKHADLITAFSEYAKAAPAALNENSTFVLNLALRYHFCPQTIGG